jgi:hypothetical protein
LYSESGAATATTARRVVFAVFFAAGLAPVFGAAFTAARFVAGVPPAFTVTAVPRELDFLAGFAVFRELAFLTAFAVRALLVAMRPENAKTVPLLPRSSRSTAEPTDRRTVELSNRQSAVQ